MKKKIKKKKKKKSAISRGCVFKFNFFFKQLSLSIE